MTLTGGKRKESSWIKFVKKIQNEQGISFKEAMTKASELKKKGKMNGGAVTGSSSIPVAPVLKNISNNNSDTSDSTTSTSSSMSGGRRRRRKSTKKRKASKKKTKRRSKRRSSRRK